MDNGWIKLHRKMTEWEWYKDTYVFCIFMHLLLHANHKENKWQGKTVGVGQLITGRKSISRQLGLSEQIVRTALTKLKSTNDITIKSTNKYSLITLVNWKIYQQETSKITNEQPAINQQSTTNKNVKKDKNEKKYSPLGAEVVKAFEEVDAKNKNYYGNTVQRGACDFLIENYSLEEVLKRVKVLPRTNKLPYFPSIFTPVQLRDKWVQLQDAVDRKRGEIQDKKIHII